MTRRLLLIISLLTALVLALAACGGAPAPAEKPAEKTTEAPKEAAKATEAPKTTEAPKEEAKATEAPKAEAAALPDLGGRKISIAVENAYLPFNYIDLKTGKPDGWDYDAWHEICKRINCVPDFVESRWDGMIVAVSQGQFDVGADGVTITDERAKVVDFSKGYISVQQRLLVRIDEKRFATTDEFKANKELLIGTQIGTTNYNTAEKWVGAERVRTFDEFGLAVQALIAGDVDAVIIDETAGLGYQGVNADKVKLVGDSLSSDQLGFIYPKGSDLVKPIDAALSAMKADGFLDTLAKKYFSANFTITYEDIATPTYNEAATGTVTSTTEVTTTETAPAAALPNLEGRKISIAVENAYLPFNYIDLKTGKPDGWDYDAWHEICKRINCVPDFVESRWDGMIVAVSQGQFDVGADGVTITDERAKVVDFSEGYVSVQQRLLVRIDEKRFATTDEFKANTKLLIGTQIGTTNYNTAEKWVGADRVRTFDDFGLAVQALIASDVDAVIIDETSGLGYQGVNADKVKLVGDSLSSDQLGFIYPKGSDLVKPVDAALSAMKADGFLDTLAKKYFSANFTITYEDIATPTYNEAATGTVTSTTEVTTTTTTTETAPAVAPSQGAVKSPFPMLADATNVTKISDESIMYFTKASIDEIKAFYQKELTAQGLTERTILTIAEKGTLNLVFDGSANGKALVIQGTEVNGSRTVSVRYESI